MIYSFYTVRAKTNSFNVVRVLEVDGVQVASVTVPANGLTGYCDSVLSLFLRGVKFSNPDVELVEVERSNLMGDNELERALECFVVS